MLFDRGLWNTSGYSLRTGATGGITLYTFQSGANTPVLSNSNILTVGEWSHIVVTKNGTAVNFYKNGVAAGSGTASNPVTSATNAKIGGYSSSGYTVDAAMDEVKVYSRAVGGTEISNRYSKVRGDYQDIRFTKADGTELPFWQETDGQYWVRYSGTLNTGDTTIYMYYGNPSASFGGSYANVTTGVFGQFDNVESETVGQNPSKWTTFENSASLVDVVSSPTYRNSSKAIKLETNSAGGTDSGVGKSITSTYAGTSGVIQYAYRALNTNQGMLTSASGAGGGLMTVFLMALADLAFILM
jgi:hypothetical protein